MSNFAERLIEQGKVKPIIFNPNFIGGTEESHNAIYKALVEQEDIERFERQKRVRRFCIVLTHLVSRKYE